MQEKLKQLKREVNNALRNAEEFFNNLDWNPDGDLPDPVVNWSNLRCNQAEYFVTDNGAEGYRLWISEADPDNSTLMAYILGWLNDTEFKDTEVRFEW